MNITCDYRDPADDAMRCTRPAAVRASAKQNGRTVTAEACERHEALLGAILVARAEQWKNLTNGAAL